METMLIFVLSLMLIFGFVAFASKPSPVYGGLSLVVSGGLGCAIIVSLNSTFLGLIVFLIYLGGMLVVFGYTAAMATEEYPESWVDNMVAFSMLLLSLLMEMVWLMVSGEVEVVMAVELFDSLGNYCVGQDWNGVSLLYGCGGWAMVLLGWILFITILVVLEVIRGL
ncbi:NADH dehydrogenase subunit 6 (mitochondrion) [Sarcophilus harrisii]|uniref:NADH-ubiquinone oxidoreductase chain 6 n=1 Tax=Sarcophilus harrisii TaxID=9305 RepID=G1FKC9_SARHA|nr:NADH dehydrogenase subunit 6 [Sarcophilus harrisii]AEL89241.1 NADH dehydrogenase subunit 6 [Sarcophilus harrisii]AFR45068.1 NADH dehydrogenase subunit 6 [Sarcophilus harrisii]AFR45081.1 NADH dehydrogenase subunit 6 [Sarcophilus harrisii]AFR45094.1 NADH dehydrogenase subunit 6 [Sarcophilus harrisii]AFR45107.1 NADH dehydrogenase subunit 6 [Sarcophilus harrisii]